MKSYFPIFLLIVLSSCETNSPVDTTVPPNRMPGEVSLAFDKASIPTEVATIAVVLSRNGFDSLRQVIDLLNDSSAEVTFNNIAVGTWNVNIKAYDSQKTVRYAGSSDVQVNEGAITNLSMVLQPVATGLGGVKIVVTWGSNPVINWKNWIHNSSNPVLKKGTNLFDKHGAGQPFLFQDGNTLKMTFLNIGVDTSAGNRLIGSIGFATSSDGGSTWTKRNTPLLTVGSKPWNSYSIAPGPIFKTQNGYTMIYTGATSEPRYTIGLATSSNGTDWERSEQPLFASQGEWDRSMIAGDVLYANGKYYLFMSYRSYGSYSMTIGLATSTDGVNWTRYGTGPIMTPTQQWEGEGVYFPSVIYENGKFIMMYSSTSSNSPSFGIATSADGIQWNKFENNPVIVKGASHATWGATEIAYPSFRKINGKYRAFYTGFNWTNSSDPQWSIGYSTVQ